MAIEEISIDPNADLPLRVAVFTTTGRGGEPSAADEPPVAPGWRRAEQFQIPPDIKKRWGRTDDFFDEAEQLLAQLDQAGNPAETYGRRVRLALGMIDHRVRTAGDFGRTEPVASYGAYGDQGVAYVNYAAVLAYLESQGLMARLEDDEEVEIDSRTSGNVSHNLTALPLRRANGSLLYLQTATSKADPSDWRVALIVQS